MRRLVGLLAVAVALASVGPAGASFLHIKRTFGDRIVPRVRIGSLEIPRHQASGRVRVIVGLRLAPLAVAPGRSFTRLGPRDQLDLSSRASRLYLARIAAAQNSAAARLLRAIPQARIGRRFQIVLDGLTVSLPARKLPALARLDLGRIYPTLRYHLATDTSTSVIGATELQTLTGAKGDGLKIGIVDDGVDSTNPFLNPAGYSYPAGFPKGGLKWTTPKVIVARAFPGPGSGAGGRLPIDREASFHATHVAGIAAGDAGTCSPGGRDHPPTCGLTGVAPRAYIGNYRVFNVPLPGGGDVANTPEIAAAFEFAVRDGMDVINFSGGGPETEPANDALVDVIRNVSAAGVVPVISAGNDRDNFGAGSVGSPGSAPDAISVAAVSNTHVFAPTLSVSSRSAPADVKRIPIAGSGGTRFPGDYAFTAHRLVDVGALTGTDGRPVDRRLCGPDDDTNNETKSFLRAGSLNGDVALLTRGHCTFFSKAFRAARAGAVALVLVDNRAGGPDAIPVELPLPAGMITDLDGARLRAYLARNGSNADVTIGSAIERVETGRSGVVTSFSSGGPTAFEHLLKPDVSAPGGQILSSTLPESTGGTPFAVFDGTSMSAPHIAGAAALLLDLHPGWSAQEVKSALVSTAAPAWADTARTQEAPVTLEGGGLVNLPRAASPGIFTEPSSLSFGDLNVSRGSDSKALLVRITDAGDGGGTWSVDSAPQATSAGAALDVTPAIVVPPGGEADFVAVARGSVAATVGENYGFILLRRGGLTRKIPYEFFVGRPQVALMQPVQLQKFQLGDTIKGQNRVSSYCCPAAPFGPPPDYSGPTMNETGAETLYVTSINRPVANLGVAVEAASAGALIDPWFLGSPNERDVQGYAGTPVNVNELMYDFGVDIGSAGASLPKVQRFYVSVDSGSDPFTHARLPGSYVLRSWVNDVRPPTVRLLTHRVATGRPTIVAHAVDRGAGVDPLSLVISYRGVLVGAALYDPTSGIAVFPLPNQAAPIRKGRTRAVLSASDYEESKNVNTVGDEVLPNTAFRTVRVIAVAGPALTWVTPVANACVGKPAELLVAASSTKRITSVRFFVDGERVAVDTRGGAGLFSGSWPTRGVPAGGHTLRAVATDSSGRTAGGTRHVRVCR